MSDLLELMLSRRDVRGNSFLPTKIEEEKLELILKSALAAPSVGYSQPWEFVLINDEAIKEKVYTNFENENTKAKEIFKDNELYENLKLEGIKEAPLNIAVLFKNNKEAILGSTSMERMGEYSVVCAIQNMWLMARSLDIGIGWVSILNEKDVLEILNVPKDRKLIAYLCLGYVKEFKEEPELKTLRWKEEKVLDQLLHFNTFNSQK
jgi:5,6-dimethylbenzimidazole synthase